MTSRISLLAHNGVAGANSVSTFGGAFFEANDIDLANASEAEISHEGRDFTFAYAEGVGTPQETLCFREKRFGEPSDWAKAKEAERVARG